MTVYKYNTPKMRLLLYDYLRDYHPDINLNTNFRCLSPDHEDVHPSMSFSPKYNICKCWACGKKYDIFSLVAQDFNISPTNFMAQVSKVAELYPNYIEINEEYLKQHPRIEEKKYPIKDYSYYFKKCQLNISKTDYLQKRGIAESLIYKYKIGYDERNESIIFPITKNCYSARSVIDDKKYNSSAKISIWNESKITDKTSFFIVTESIIDALSLETIGCDIPVTSLCGVTHYKNLIDKVKSVGFDGTVILSFDNDHWGKTWGKLVEDELHKIGIKTINYPFTHEFKDINEALMSNKESLVSALSMLEQAVKSKENHKELESSKKEVSAKEPDSLEI